MSTSASPTSSATEPVAIGLATDSTSDGVARALAIDEVALIDVPGQVDAFMADLHLAMLPLGFFGSLGRRFLRQYYRTFLASPHASAIVAVQREGPVGFVVGTLQPVEHLRWTLRTMGSRLALAAGAALIGQPGQLIRFIRTRAARYVRAVLRHTLRGREQPSPQPTGESGTTAVLWHVAVARERHGRGIGRKLVSAFLQGARDAGSTRAVLITQSTDAAAFYERLGWSRSAQRLDQDGNVVFLYETAL